MAGDRTQLGSSRRECSRPSRRGHYTFDLGKLGARAGDIITYYASAYDNYPGGGHFADTPTSVIHVISQTEFAEFAPVRNTQMDELAKEFDAFRRRLENLKSRREEMFDKNWPALDKKLTPAGSSSMRRNSAR